MGIFLTRVWGLGDVCTLAAGFFSLAAAGFAAGSFLASFTVPEGPVWVLGKYMLDWL